MPEQQAFDTTLKTFDTRIPVFSKKPTEKWGEYHADDWTTYLRFLGLEGKVDPKPYYTNDLIDEVNKFDENAVRQFARNYKM
jgi:hypothetical protein